MVFKINEREGEERPLARVDHLPAELYRVIEELARRKKVSLAWVIRDAAEKYVASME